MQNLLLSKIIYQHLICFLAARLKHIYGNWLFLRDLILGSLYINETNNKRKDKTTTQESKKKHQETNHDSFPVKKLYMLVEMAIVLVTTARIIMTAAKILSLAVDIPQASL